MDGNEHDPLGLLTPAKSETHDPLGLLQDTGNEPQSSEIPVISMDEKEATKNLVNTDKANKNYFKPLQSELTPQGAPEPFMMGSSQAPNDAPAYTPRQRALILGTVEKFESNPIFKNEKYRDVYFQSLGESGLQLKGAVEKELAIRKINRVATSPADAFVHGIKEGVPKMNITPEGIAETVAESASKRENVVEAALAGAMKPIAGTIETAMGVLAVTPPGAAFVMSMKAGEELAPEATEKVSHVLAPVSTILQKSFEQSGKEVPDWLQYGASAADFLVQTAAFMGAHKAGAKLTPKKITPENIQEAADYVSGLPHEKVEILQERMGMPEVVEWTFKENALEKDLQNLPQDHPLTATIAAELAETKNNIETKIQETVTKEAPEVVKTSETEFLNQEKVQIEELMSTLGETGKAVAEKRLQQIDETLKSNQNGKSSSKQTEAAKEKSTEKTDAEKSQVLTKAEPEQAAVVSNEPPVSKEQEITELTQSITKLREDNPTQFKKDGTPKENAPAEIKGSYRAFTDMIEQRKEDIEAGLSEAKTLASEKGFEHPAKLINTVNKDLGTEYKNVQDIPEKSIDLVAQTRAQAKQLADNLQSKKKETIVEKTETKAQVEETKPKKPVPKQKTDLKGEEKKEWMLTKDEYLQKLRDSNNYPVMDALWERVRTGDYKKTIENALEFHNYLEKGQRGTRSEMRTAIKEGRMTAENAATIIESAGIEVPKDISDLIKPESSAPKPAEAIQKNEPPTKEQRKQEADNLIAEGLDGIFSKFGAKKNLLPEEKTTLIEDFKKVLNGVVAKGLVSIEEAIESAKAYIKKKYGDKVSEQELSEIEAAMKTEGEKASGIKKEITDKEREEAGLEEFDRTSKKDAELQKEAQDWIDKGGDMGKLLDQLEKTHDSSDVKNTVLAKYKASLEARIEKNPTPEVLAEHARILELIPFLQQKAGRLLRSFAAEEARVDNLSNFLYDRSKDKGRELTAEEIKQEKTDYENLKLKKEELESELAAEREKYNKLVAEKGVNQARAEMKRGAKKSHEQHIQDRKKIVADAREALKKIRTQTYSTVPLLNELRALAPHVKNYAKDLIGEGVSKLDDIVTQAHADFKDVIEGLQKSDIVDILANVHDEKKATKSEKNNQIRLIQREAELLKKLGEVRKGIESTKNEVKKKEGNARITELEKKIKEVRKLNRERELTFDADHVLDKTPEGKAKAREKFLEEKVKKLRQDIATGDYAKEPVKEKPLILSRRARDLQDEVINLEKNIRLKRYSDQQTKLQGAGRVIKKILRTTRIAQTILDWSVLARQLNKVTMNPFHADITIKAAKAQAKTTFSEKNFDRFMDEIHKDDQYHDMVDDNIIYNDLNTGTQKTTNEEFQQSYLNDIPVLGSAVRASNRGADAAMNTARFELYKQRRARLEKEGYSRESDPEVFKQMGNWVMNMTGRGTQFKFLEQPQIQAVLGNTLYGQRLMASHLNVLNPMRYVDLKYFGDNTKAIFNKSEFKKYDPVRKQGVRDLVGYTTGVVLTAYMLQKAGATVSLDPDDSDFLQVRFGEKVYDITGGSAAYARTGLRLMEAAWTRKEQLQGNVSEKDAESKANFAAGSTSRFLRNKLAPNTSNFVNMFFGKNTVGEKFEWTDFVELYPMYTEDTYEAMQDEGISAIATVLLPNLIGVGYGSYAQKANKEAGGSKLKLNKIEGLKLEKLDLK